MTKNLAYSVLDVFAERALEGNPLAVFHDGRGLSDAEMQALARETNLSETTFILPADDPEEDVRDGVRVRIFTTEEELPFAGHPTLGTASWLHLNHGALKGAAEVTLRLQVGRVPVRFYGARQGTGEDGEPRSVYGVMRQPDPQFGAEYDPAEVAAVIGVPETDLLPGYRPQSVSTGNAFCIVPFRSVEALAGLQIPQREASAWLRARGMRWFYCVAPEAEPGAAEHRAAEPGAAERKRAGLPGLVWRARMQWNGGEDPATGSAAGPCIAWLVRVGLAPAGQSVALRQGVEMLRPSLLEVQAARVGGTIGEVHVGGRTVPVATGRFFLFP